MTYERELNLAKMAARAAGEVILNVYRESYSIAMKTNDTPVTRADLEANDVIVSALFSEFPKYGLLSEEAADDLSRLDKEYCWIVDPLDGTKEFIKKNDEFAVNIALCKGHEVVLGVIYMPVFNEMYYAVKGQGAWFENELRTVQIKVSDRDHDLKVLKSRSHETHKYTAILKKYQNRIVKTKNVGSSYKGCLIAKGDYDVYYSFGITSIWDIAPVDILVTEAGGYFAQGDCTPFEYNVENTRNHKGFMILNKFSNKMTECEGC